MKRTMVFGAGGRIGLPLSAYISKFSPVYGVELEQEYVDKLNTGVHVPFRESGLAELLAKSVNKEGWLEFVTYEDAIKDKLKHTDEYVIMIGTPKKDDTLDTSGIFKIIDDLKANDSD